METENNSAGRRSYRWGGAGANFEGGFAGEKGAYLVSWRKSYLDLIHNTIGLTSIPHYWDTQFRLSYDPGNANSLSLLGLYARDWISVSAEKGDSWSRGAESVDARGYNLMLGGRLRLVGENGYREIILARSQVFLQHDVYEMPEHRQFYFHRSTEALDQLHYSYTGSFDRVNEYSYGVSLKPLTFKHERWMEQDTTVYDDFDFDGLPDTMFSPEWSIDRSATSLKYAAYAQYRRGLSNNLTLSSGLRYDGFTYSDDGAIGPRLSLKWDVRPGTSLNTAWGVYYQSHPILVYTLDPDGLNGELPFSRAVHYIGGINQQVNPSLQISLEAYYKDYKNLPVSEEDLLPDDAIAPRSFRRYAIGRKWAWGLEFFAQKKLLRKWYSTLSYSYGHANFDNSIETYPADYDFRHVGTLVLGYQFSGIPLRAIQRRWYGWWMNVLPVSGDEMSLSTRFRYVTGRPYTPRVWTDQGVEFDYHWKDSGEINSARYPDYSRFDIRLDDKWYFGRKAVVTFFEIENIFDRKNVAQYIYADDGEVDTVYQFRFFFVGGVRFEW